MRTILSFVILLVSLSAFGQSAVSTVRDAPSIAVLRSLNTLSPQGTVSVKGYTTPGDGGGGTFELDPTSVVPDDGGMVIAPTAGAGRWRRKVSGRDYSARWWGPTKTNATIQAAIDWVSANGWGKVICDGGTWTVKSDDASRITMKTGVTLVTAEDSQIVCAANPADSWIMVDVPPGTSDFVVGPATLVGWNLAPPGGDTNKTGVIVRLRGTINGTVGGVKASNWYSIYADVDENNGNIQMFDADWQLGGMSFGAKGDGVTDDRNNLQAFGKFCERYDREFFLRSTTNGYLIGGSPGDIISGGVWFTNHVPVRVRGENTLVRNFYYNPTEGTLPHVSAAFVVSSDNCSFSGIRFGTTGSFPASETNQSVTGFFVPIIIHNATNTLVERCEFSNIGGKGMSTSGSYTRIRDCFFDRCGVSTGLGNYDDWLFYEAAVPLRGLGHSPIGVSIMNCTFFKGSPYKHCVLFSSADDIICTGNKFMEMDSPNPINVYSGDLGVTDLRGTNVYRFGGTISHNTITGTNFGLNAAILVRLNTTTNFVPSTFTPSNMYSAVIVSENHIYGTGTTCNGIETIAGRGTQIINNEILVTGYPIGTFGDSDTIVMRGNVIESTVGFGVTLPIGEAFEAPPSFSDMVIEDNSITTPEGDEYCIRNIEPLYYRNLKLHNNRFFFRGAQVVSDAPKVIQLSSSQGFIDVDLNKFYLTNVMSGRRIATFSGTNSTLNFTRNSSFVMDGAMVTRRGIQSAAQDVNVKGNDVGSMEFNGVLNLTLTDNFITSGDAYPYCLETWEVGRAMIQNNTLSNYFAGSTFCTVIRATNSTFEGNTMIGTSDSVLAVNNFGKMYAGNNLHINLGSGSLYISPSPPGTVTSLIYEQPMNIDIGSRSFSPFPFTLERAGSGSILGLNADNEQAEYYAFNRATNQSDGHVFWVHEANTPTNIFAYGFRNTGDGRFLVGDTTLGTSTFDSFMFAHASNAVLRVMSTNTTGTYDAGLSLHVNGHAADQHAGTISFIARDLSQSEETYAKIIGTGNVSGFDKRGMLTLQTANAAGNVQDAVTIDHQQYVSVPQRIILGTGAHLIAGTGNPENVVSAPVGSFFYRTDGNGGFYSKTNGVGNTGWALGAGGGGGGIGDVVGPASSTDNQLALFNSTTGKLLKNTSVFEDTGSTLRPTANNTKDLGDLTHFFKTGYFGTDIILSTLIIDPTTGTPEGATLADSGSVSLRKDGGPDSSAYIKVGSDGTTTNWYPIPTQDAYVFICGDETTAMSTGVKRTKRIPFAMVLTEVRAQLVTAQASGTIFTVDVKESGTTIFSTLLTIDNGQTTSVGAVTPYVLSDFSLAENAPIAVSVTQIGNGTAAGLTVTLIGHR